MMAAPGLLLWLLAWPCAASLLTENVPGDTARMMLGEEVLEEPDGTVRMAAIAKGTGTRMINSLRIMVASLLTHSEDVTVLLTLLTDQESLEAVRAAAEAGLGQFVTEGVVFGHEWNNVSLKTEFVDLDRLTDTLDRRTLDKMKELFGPANKSVTLEASDPRRKIFFPHLGPDVVLSVENPAKFDKDLFFVAPFYHRFFPNLKRLVVVDLDLEFKVGVAEVRGLFSLMSGGQLLGMVRDQSPHYPFLTGNTPTKRQGLNSGLVLFSLAEMRASSEYNMELARDRMDSLSEAFLPSPDWNLSEQDWFSLLSWSRPHLFSILPCRYNVMFCFTPLDGKKGPGGRRGMPGGVPCLTTNVAVAHFCGV